MKSSERARSVVVVGVLGAGAALVGASCLRVNDAHCMWSGGDAACGERFCVAAVEGGADALAAVGADGCIEAVPRDDAGEIATGVAYVRYGLVADEAERDEILRRAGVDVQTCTDLPSVEAIGRIAGNLRARGRVRREAAALTEAERGIIHEFNARLRERIEACGGGETTGTTTEGEDTTDGTTEGTESTTGPQGCVEDVDCRDAESPLCGPMGQCVACNDASVDGDGGCAAKAELEGTTEAICAEEGPRAGQCVECTEDAPWACTGEPPLCDVETNTCQPCVLHEQCGEAACNLFTGVCLPADAVVHVGPGVGMDFATLASAVASVGEGEALTVVVHQADYNESVTVEGGRVLAFLAAEGDLPAWALIGGGAPQLTVGEGTVVMEGLQLSGNAAGTHPAVRVTGGQVWVDRGRVIDNNGGGVLAEGGAEVVLRNSFLGGNVEAVVLDIRGSTSDIVYTTLGAGFGVTASLVCDAAAAVTLRNSLVVSRSDDAEVVCPGLDATYTASEAVLVGTGNVTLGPMVTTWFAGFNAGDFHLTAMAPAAIATTAQWSPGDPATDIDGDPRPTTNAAADYAGADVP
jgi:hypothetical protein